MSQPPNGFQYERFPLNDRSHRQSLTKMYWDINAMNSSSFYFSDIEFKIGILEFQKDT